MYDVAASWKKVGFRSGEYREAAARQRFVPCDSTLRGRNVGLSLRRRRRTTTRKWLMDERRMVEPRSQNTGTLSPFSVSTLRWPTAGARLDFF